ncbi:MAG: hypothetical protein JSS34_01935 [Proteobacteria bacterium]|nr:hypothetical protein [Pseudomonadota bacterium]
MVPLLAGVVLVGVVLAGVVLAGVVLEEVVRAGVVLEEVVLAWVGAADPDVIADEVSIIPLKAKAPTETRAVVLLIFEIRL